MTSHSRSIFLNSCLRVPVDPITKMPTTHYERQSNRFNRCRQNTRGTKSISPTIIDKCDQQELKVKDFYMSIPDYSDIHHLSEDEFNKMLKRLREKKRKLLGLSVNIADDIDIPKDVSYSSLLKIKAKSPETLLDKPNNIGCENKSSACNDTCSEYLKEEIIYSTSPERVRFYETEDEIDKQFKKFFIAGELERKCRSMPTSPLKSRRSSSAGSFEKNRFISVKPFKMTLRDEDSRKFKRLKNQTKFFSEEMLDRKSEKQRFRANPVPIESRIPLYDKIMEDQAMRSAIVKLNSAAELQSQIKPFKFTLRDEMMSKLPCSKLDPPPELLDAPIKSKNRFRARPVPKNLFSNYVPEKMKEDEFFRAMNRRIRAEELLKSSSLPPSMAARNKTGQKTRVSTPAGAMPSDNTSELSLQNDSRSRVKGTARITNGIAGGPYHKKKQVKSSSSKSSNSKLFKTSPFEDRSSCRPNLAALLRLENTKKKIEDEIERRQNEREYRAEIKWRDHILRKKPAWDMVKNNSRQDIAIRLQTRRDEERLLREQFQHEMELMYDRVREQPLLFERYYYPVRRSKNEHCSPRKSSLRKLHKKNNSGTPFGTYTHNTPIKERKVSIEDAADSINEDLEKYLKSCENNEREETPEDDNSEIESETKHKN